VDSIVITVIDDGSSDDTARLARVAGANVIAHSENLGLGTAFRSGLRSAIENNADIMVTVDGDGQFDTRQIPQLVQPILDGRCDLSLCSRFKDPALLPAMPRSKVIGNNIVAKLVSRMTGKRFYDVSCGFRAYNEACMVRLNLMGMFTYTHEVIMELVFQGLRAHEVPLPVRGVRSHSESRIASNLVRYGVQTSRIMLSTLLSHRPHVLFGVLAAMSTVLGLLLVALGSVTYFTANTFIKVLVLPGAFMLALAVALLLFGLQARVLYRNHFLLQNILAEMRTRDRKDSRSK
jgi:glycosyltransferase involved in cell wall biosynthesis